MCVYIYIYIYILQGLDLGPKPTKNSEGQPNKLKTINLLENGSYKQNTKPRKYRLKIDWVQIDGIKHTNSTKYLPQTNSRTKCSYIDQVSLFTKCSSLSCFSLNLACLYLWRQFPYIVLPNTSQPSTCSISMKSFGCLSYQGSSGGNRKGCELGNTVQMLFLYKCSQFNWYSAFNMVVVVTFLDIFSFYCWYDSATSHEAHLSRVIDFLKRSQVVFVPREPRLPHRTPFFSSAFQTMYTCIF